MVIIAAGLTPAWQQIVSLAELKIGGVNRAQSLVWCPSGKVLNVGSALHHLGAASRTVSFYGGETGWLMRREFDHLGVNATWVETQAATRICTTILDHRSGTTTELVENAQPVSAEELDRFAETFAAAARTAGWAILTGSLPCNTPAKFFRRLMESTPARVLLDIRGPELKACLPLKPFLVKPNREELALTMGSPIATQTDLLDAMQELRRLGAQRVVVSQGPDELWLVNDAGCFRFRPPRVPTVNPIGCGDCLSAGLAAAFSEGRSDVDAVAFGMAAAAENAQGLLPARLNRNEVDHLVKLVEILGP
jgi:tagatose 6-phosphate kinase